MQVFFQDSNKIQIYFLPIINFYYIFQEHDGADDLLSAERAHLVNCKRALEAQLRSVQQQLLVS